MTQYVDRHLMPGEGVLYRSHVSFVPIISKAMSGLLLGSVLGGFTWSVTGNMSTGIVTIFTFVLLALLSCIPHILNIIGTELVITNTKVRGKRGVFSIKDDREVALEKIDRIDVDQTWWQRIMGYGDISLETVGTYDFMRYRKITDPNLLRTIFNEARRRAEEGEDSFSDYSHTIAGNSVFPKDREQPGAEDGLYFGNGFRG